MTLRSVRFLWNFHLCRYTDNCIFLVTWNNEVLFRKNESFFPPVLRLGNEKNGVRKKNERSFGDKNGISRTHAERFIVPNFRHNIATWKSGLATRRRRRRTLRNAESFHPVRNGKDRIIGIRSDCFLGRPSRRRFRNAIKRTRLTRRYTADGRKGKQNKTLKHDDGGGNVDIVWKRAGSGDIRLPRAKYAGALRTLAHLYYYPIADNRFPRKSNNARREQTIILRFRRAQVPGGGGAFVVESLPNYRHVRCGVGRETRGRGDETRNRFFSSGRSTTCWTRIVSKPRVSAPIFQRFFRL